MQINKSLLLASNDLKVFNHFYEKIQVLTPKQGLIGHLKRKLILKFGLVIDKNKGKGTIQIVFSNQLKPRRTSRILIINLKDSRSEKVNRIHLLETFLKFKKIKLNLDNFNDYTSQDKTLLKKYLNQIHPEALALASICKGKGADIGCGHRKTHPEAIGIDLIKGGKKGKFGNVKGQISVADIQARGNDLHMFTDNSLDYVVSRHHLEHYKNPEKTLKEWLRVLKMGGLIGIVVPSSENPQTQEATHYYNFNMAIFKKMIKSTGKIKILKIDECIPNWSLFCIGQKI